MNGSLPAPASEACPPAPSHVNRAPLVPPRWAALRPEPLQRCCTRKLRVLCPRAAHGLALPQLSRCLIPSAMFNLPPGSRKLLLAGNIRESGPSTSGRDVLFMTPGQWHQRRPSSVEPSQLAGCVEPHSGGWRMERAR